MRSRSQVCRDVCKRRPAALACTPIHLWTPGRASSAPGLTGTGSGVVDAKAGEVSGETLICLVYEWSKSRATEPFHLRLALDKLPVRVSENKSYKHRGFRPIITPPIFST